MEITREKIEKLSQLYDELDALQRQMNDADAAAKEFKENIVIIARKDGTTSEVPEKALWDEIYQLGKLTEAYGVMSAKYPKVFELTEACNVKAEEIMRFGVAELGIDPLRVRLSDIFRLVEAVVDLKLASDDRS
jgi:hypothetical protein